MISHVWSNLMKMNWKPLLVRPKLSSLRAISFLLTLSRKTSHSSRALDGCCFKNKVNRERGRLGEWWQTMTCFYTQTKSKYVGSMIICTTQHNMKITNYAKYWTNHNCTLLCLMRKWFVMLPEGRIHGGPKAWYETHLGARLLPTRKAVHVHLHLVPVWECWCSSF